MENSKIRAIKNVVLGIAILVTFVYLFLSEYIYISNVVVGVFVGVCFMTISALGLLSKEVYFTRSEPTQYKNPIIGRIVNTAFGILGLAIIIMTIVN